LGLTHHPEVIKAAKDAIDKFGTGAGASRLISGTTILHQQLEEKLAQYKGCEAAIVFPTGYMANIGTISTILNPTDTDPHTNTVIIDRLNHASIIDACKLSKAKLQVYPHKDMGALEKILKRSAKFSKRLIVTDLVFSMDGDIAPIQEIATLAQKYDAMLMTDEAHATGVLTQDTGHRTQDLIIMGTLSKALGSLGGFICGSQELIDYLRNKARSFIYTTALPPANCAAALKALELLETQPEIQQKLWENISYFRSCVLGLESCSSPIIPIIIGETEKTLEVSAKLFEHGIYVSAIRPPTVPKGQSRLRITLSALHTKEDIKCLASLLQELIPAAAKQYFAQL